ncbi:unnamed protein product [Adineta ricciae]|uniref:RING-type domain-containing protein n=1 Tax=Adineta ricciae TaxID=249248 RepID=A0A814UDR4_ADIRI|nr:unnamed protein product [Adineta ricciae]
MSNPDNCPNCDNIYGNEPRKIPCGHIVCHKCCLELFNKEDNTLICPVCDVTHSFKSKNIFKKSLQQVAHSGFGKKTATREVAFASSMPVEKASGAEKSVLKEVKKAAAHLPTAPPGAPPEGTPTNTTPPSSHPPPPPPPPPPAPEPITVAPKPPPPAPLMPPRSSATENLSKLVKLKTFLGSSTPPPSLLNGIISSPVTTPTPPPPPPPIQLSSASEAVIARCHSCGNKCQVIVCDHCDHFVCFKCAEEHRATTKVDTQELTNKWQTCKNKYSTLLQKLNQYSRDRTQIESDLAAIRVAIEQRTRDATQLLTQQRDLLIGRINEHIENEQTVNSIKHSELANAFQQIQIRYENALNGGDIGSYTQDDFLRDIRELQNRMSKRNDLIETHILKIPTVARYERVSIEKLLGELRFNPPMMNALPNLTIPSLLNHQSLPKQNGFLDHSSIFPNKFTSNLSPKLPPGVPPPSVNTITPPTNHIASATTDAHTVKPLMADTRPNSTLDPFDEFRRMAAQIHHEFNAPYSKVINAASSPAHPSSFAMAAADGNPMTNGSEKTAKTLPATSVAQNKTPSTNTFTKSWKIEHTAVPNFLCMTPYPTPKIFVVDKYGKVSVCSVPPKLIKPFDSYTLFPNDTDEWIESVVASSRFLIVYSRKKQDTMTGTLYFFTHECKPVLPNGIHQNIPVHHILCDQNANRLYCLDRMRCTIYYHTLPNSLGEIETCMKTRRDFTQFNSNYTAVKMLQNDDILGFYERNDCTVHLYDKQTAEKIEEFKCEHFMDKFESWGIIAIRKDNNSLIFKIDERADHDAVTRQHIVYEVHRATKQIISKIQLNSVFGMIIGPNNEVILGIRQTKESGIVQCYDARQLRCGHSFCYQCIVSHFEPTSNRIICSRCKRIHQFDSFAQFETSLIVDAFVMSLVDEHRRKKSISVTPLLAFTLEQILERSPAPFLIAKCAQCTLRKELVVCPECEQVICFECISQHQLIVNNNVQQSWMKCKQMWNYMYEKSILFDEQQFDLESHMYELQSRIEKRENFLRQTIEKWREIYLCKINQYAQRYESIREDIASQFQSIDQRIQVFLSLTDPDPIKAECFLQEINDFRINLRQKHKQIDLYSHQLPKYSTSDLNSSLLGEISLQTSIEHLRTSIDDDNNEANTINEEESVEINDNESIKSDETPQQPDERDETPTPTNKTLLGNISNKKLLWSIHFKFVPQYIVLYRQSILFASDRWGFVSTWTYTNAHTKPTPKKSFVLFPQFRVGTWSRVYVESFSVYKPYICVFVKGSDESLANFIAFFTHTGQLQMKVEYEHRYTLRQLICDESPKGNCIWAVDRGMHCIYKHDLPRTTQEIQSFLTTHKSTTRLNDRTCDVIRMAINQNLLAILGQFKNFIDSIITLTRFLDSRTQIVTFFDKLTQKEVGVYAADYLPTGDNKLWRVEIFPDNSLLLRFDDNERTGDRSQVIHHVVIHVRRNESNGSYEAISQIQATNVYGFAIGSESEVIVGLRKANCFEGLINCYV